MESVVNSIVPYYAGKKVFVTGHTGFKGAWFITWLYLLQAKVKGYALAPEDEKGIFNIVAPKIAPDQVFADIRNKEKLFAEIRDFQPDIVFHLAAQALVRKSYEMPTETFEVNVEGTANVLEAVRQLPGKCTVVIITTDKVYKNREQDYYYREEDTLGGFDPYSASKAAAEIVVEAFRNSFFNPANYAIHQKVVASVRAGNVIGGGDWSEGRIIPDIMRSLTIQEIIPVRNPSAVRPWQHVLESLSGYLLAGMLLDKDALQYSGAYNFGPEAADHLSVKELVETAIAGWGSGKWKDISDSTQPHEAGLLQLDISKAKRQLGWHPKLNSREAIQWTIDWYRQNPLNVFDFTLQQIKNYQQK